MCIFNLIDKCDLTGLTEALQAPEIQLRTLLEATRNNQETPVQAAFGRLQIARQQQDNELTERAFQCLTLLIETARERHPDLLTQPDESGYTPVATAIRCGEFEITLLLLRSISVTQNVCYRSYTPLEYAFQCGTLANFLGFLHREGPDAIAGFLAIPHLDEGSIDGAVSDIIADIINGEAQYNTLRQLVRLPVSQALLSVYVIEALDIDNYEAAMILLANGASPTMSQEGEIMAGADLTRESVPGLAAYCFACAAQDENINSNRLTLKSLLLLAYGCQTTFDPPEISRFSLVDLAQCNGLEDLARSFAALGIDPCFLFENFIANPTEELLPYVIAAFEGLQEVWEKLNDYGFYGRWLFLGAYQGPETNRLVNCLPALSNIQLIAEEHRESIETVYNCIRVIDLDEIAPLGIQIISKYEPDDDFWSNARQDPGFPWQEEESRRLAFYCRGLYQSRSHLTPAQRGLALIRFRALQEMLNLGVSLQTINRILKDLEG